MNHCGHAVFRKQNPIHASTRAQIHNPQSKGAKGSLVYRKRNICRSPLMFQVFSEFLVLARERTWLGMLVHFVISFCFRGSSIKELFVSVDSCSCIYDYFHIWNIFRDIFTLLLKGKQRKRAQRDVFVVVLFIQVKLRWRLTTHL